MKMKRSLALVSAAAILLTVGCGGGGSDSTPDATGKVNFTGAETVTTALPAGVTTTVPATGGSAPVTAADGSSIVIPSGVLPAGATVTSTTDLAVIPAGVGFAGTFASGTAITFGSVAGDGTVTDGPDNSGAGVSSSGLLSVNVAVPILDPVGGSEYEINFPEGDLDTRVLTVKRFKLRGKFYKRNGKVVSPIPTGFSGNLPNNGENAAGSNITATFGAGNNNRKATLYIQYTSNANTSFKLTQVKTIAANKVTFTDVFKDAAAVPSNGVFLVRLTLGNL